MLLAALLFALQTPAPEAGPPRARGWDDFPVLVWREKYAGKPLPDELVLPFGGVILMRQEDSAWARERGLSYLVWNVAGRDALHLDADEAWNARVEKWIETHDGKLLVREPCLNDPQTVARLYATLDATIAKHGEHPGLGFVLGDEVSLTPNGDPFDLCRCGICEAKWKAHAEERHLPERAPLTDEVRVALLEDDYSLLGAWLARRRFDQENLLALLSSLAARARGSRERLVGLLGLRGQSAFGGLNVLSAKGFADFLEGYPCADTLALLSSRRPFARLTDGVRRAFPGHDATLSTLFLGPESPPGAAWLAWASWMRGSDALVLWNDAELERDPVRNERLASAVSTIRTVRERFPSLPTPLPRRVALVNDADSTALAWLRDALLDGPSWPRRRAGYQQEHGSLETKQRTWTERAEALGIQLGGTTLASLEADDFDVLILPEVLVLGSEDLVRLEHHVQGGGTLLVDGHIGWVDRTGSPWREDVLQRLRRSSSQRVLEVQDEGFARAALRSAAQASSTLEITMRGSRGEPKWWITERATKDFGGCFAEPEETLVVALPIARSPEQRARLEPMRLEVKTTRSLEWIHPSEGEPLPPGDAALFLLH